MSVINESPHNTEADVVVGKIVGVWGLNGGLKVLSLTDFSDRFCPGSVLYLQGRSVLVQDSRRNRDNYRVKLNTISNRNQAELVLGCDLTVRNDDVRSLPDGIYYHFQILGLCVWNEHGEYFGTIKEIIKTGSNDVYSIRNDDKGELLVPATKDVILKVDLLARKMVVSLPDGLT